MISREVVWTIFQAFGMTRPGIEARPTAYKASILPPGHECGACMLGGLF